MTKSCTALLLAAVTMIATSAPAGADSSDDLRVALRAAVADYQLPGGVAALRDPTTAVVVEAGSSDVATGAGFAPHTHVRAASITKTFVAATVLQLVAEGRVDLDASIETYLPNRIRGNGFDGHDITVRQLLRHQSGLPEYFGPEDGAGDGLRTPDQLLDLALGKPASFPPGTDMLYTNTNYLVAGLLIEAVTGSPAPAEITRRIIDPLGLTDTYFPAIDDTGLRVPFAHGYELVDGTRSDVTELPASQATTAGSLISSADDMSAFLSALLDGRVIPRPQLAQMMDTVPWPGAGPDLAYGLGLIRFTTACGRSAWGHSGDIDGFHTVMAKAIQGPTVSVTFTQSPPSDGLVDGARSAIVDAVFCPPRRPSHRMPVSGT